MKGIIYKITNKVNNKVYIGQTRYSLEFRWRQHINKKDDTYFHNAIQKYGKDNFTIEVLEECDVEKLDQREMYYISKYNSFSSGYNLTIGGSGVKTLLLDNKYEEIKELYLSGFSAYKISTLYGVDKGTILKILKSLGIKIRKNYLNINRQEVEELKLDYESGYSLKELAKRYNCSSSGIKSFLQNKGVDIRKKYSILEDTESHNLLINDYIEGVSLSEIQKKYRCSYNTFTKILSMYGISRKGKGGKFKMTDAECLECIRLYTLGIKVSTLSKKFEVDKCTIYSLLKRYNIQIQ